VSWLFSGGVRSLSLARSRAAAILTSGRMGQARVGRGWVKAGVVWLPRGYDLLHGVVDVEDDAPGAVVAVELRFVLAADDGEGVHAGGYGVARRREAGREPRPVCRRLAVCRAPGAALLGWQVEVEEGGVQLAPE